MKRKLLGVVFAGLFLVAAREAQAQTCPVGYTCDSPAGVIIANGLNAPGVGDAFNAGWNDNGIFCGRVRLTSSEHDTRVRFASNADSACEAFFDITVSSPPTAANPKINLAFQCSGGVLLMQGSGAVAAYAPIGNSLTVGQVTLTRVSPSANLAQATIDPPAVGKLGLAAIAALLLGVTAYVLRRPS